jgi:transcription factor TFIIIB component B''
MFKGYMYGRRPTKRWTHPETKQFFYCLTQVGPDFSLMETMFPKRTRQELKLKFKHEERVHGTLVELALKAATRPMGTKENNILKVFT